MELTHILSTLILIIIVAVAAYLVLDFSEIDHIIPKSSENVDFYRNVSCEPIAEDFKDAFVSCGIKTCGRSVSDLILSPGEVRLLVRIARRYFPLSFIVPGTYISSLNLEEHVQHLNPEEAAFVRLIGARIASVIRQRYHLQDEVLIRTQPTIFYRVHKAVHGNEDTGWYSRSGYFLLKSWHTFKAVIFLTSYGTDHTGGRFWIGKPFKIDILEPKPGRMISFTLSKENKNMMEAIDDGSYLSLAFYFTCKSSVTKHALIRR